MSKKKRASQENTNNKKALVFLNTPIQTSNDDILGFQAYVDSLQSAIDSNAQMIAITSPFGAGKSSVIELLRSQKSKQKVISLSMWSHLCKDDISDDNQTIELHRSFLYQIVSKLNSRLGTYISRRLSKSYGLLKLHTEKLRYYVIAFLSLVCFILGYILPYKLNIGIPTIWGTPELWNGMLLLLSVVCFVYVIIRAEIVFSSNKSEGSRSIDENELVDLYQEFVIKYCKKKNKTKKFIFVIEDLDRTDKNECVVTFLKELRKYYLQNNKSNDNKVVFIVNVKPETSLNPQALNYKTSEKESLYAKLFDYVLNIQTINIDDYETVLESILNQNEQQIRDIFPQAPDCLVKIPGMQWIIRGKNFGVRDIKDRLNRAFTLYSSLNTRFNHDGNKDTFIEFEKCAVVSYLTTTYEKEFCNTSDRSFGILVEAFLQSKLDENLCKQELNSTNEAYTKDVYSLITSKLIDSNYRMYFYNHPKASKIYTHDENVVQKSILYGETADGLDHMVERVSSNNLKVIHDALDRLEELNLKLPDIIFDNEKLYIITLQHYPEGIYDWVSNLDYSKNAYEKISKKLLNILAYDSKRYFYSEIYATQFCQIWEDKFKEDELLQFRSQLCSSFPDEIRWYQTLFTDIHNIITIDELKSLKLNDVIRMIDLSKDEFSVDYVEYVLNRLEHDSIDMVVYAEQVMQFLLKAETKLGTEEVVDYLLWYMHITKKVIATFENSVMDMLTSKTLSDTRRKVIFDDYQGLINNLDEANITENTLKNIHTLGIFDGYNHQIAGLLKEHGYIFEFSIVSLSLGEDIDYCDNMIVCAINDNLTWLLQHPDTLHKLRVEIIKFCSESSIVNYLALFSPDCPILTNNEFDSAKNLYSDETIISLIPASIVTEKQCSMLSQYFNRRFQSNNLAFNILIYISKMKAQIGREIFYSLNFDSSFKYSSFSAERKKTIKNSFYNMLDLEDTSEKILFMHSTRYLDSSWEKEICDEISENESLAKSYIMAVNEANPKSVTNSTIECICSLSSMHALNDTVTERLYEAKKYTHYVISKTLRKSQFIMDDSTRLEQLWATYMKIFSDGAYPKTTAYMESSSTFLSAIIDRGAYVGLPIKRYMVLSEALQSSDSILNALTYGNNFAVEYFSKIKGFRDKSAAETFVGVVEENQTLLRSNSVYDNCHEKLVNGPLKARYTRLRKKKGYMS